MRFSSLGLASFLALSGALATACGDGGTGGSGGGGTSSATGAGGATSSSTATSTASATSSGAGGGPSVGPFACSGKAVSFSGEILPLFQNNCTGDATCHGSLTTSSATLFAALKKAAPECTDGRLMVKPSDPEHSYVVQKLTDQSLCSGEPMPRSILMTPWSPLANDEIQKIYDWICAGAPDN